MKKINKSIDRLCDMLYHKGYDGIYVLNAGNTGKLPDLLKAHLLNAVSDPMNALLPVKLSTIIALHTHNNQRYLTAEFSADYDSRRGVHIMACSFHAMDLVTRQANYSKHLALKDNSDLPTACQAIQMIKKRR